MDRLTVVYKYGGKIYIGIIDKDDTTYITNFERLMVNEKEFEDNKFFIAMVSNDDHPEIVVIDHFKTDFSYIKDEVTFIVLANQILTKFRLNAVVH
jgi:hypothetical protein